MQKLDGWEKIISASENGVQLVVKISPGASRTKIMGPYGDCIKIAVQAPPEKGKANSALIAFLAKILKTSKQNISIRTGLTSPQKVLFIENITANQCLDVLKKNI